MADYVDIISMGLKDPNLKPAEGGFQTVDPGTYDFEITKTAMAQSRKGNNTLRVTAKVVGPEGTPMLDRSMMGSYIIDDSEFARGRMLCFINGCQAPLDDDGGFSRDALVGLQFTADVEARDSTAINPKNGMEETKTFTSWVRERPCGSEPEVTSTPAPAASKAATGKATTTAKPATAAATSSTPRRPAAPAGAGAR